MTAAILATTLATLPVSLAAWLIFRRLTAPPTTGRHRLAADTTQYRPRPAAAITGPVVIPGHPDPGATSVVDVRDMAVPVPLPWRQAPLSAEVQLLASEIRAAERAALTGGGDTRELAQVQ